MRTAAALIALSLVIAWYASGLDHTTVVWAALVVVAAGTAFAAVLRVHTVVNAPEDDR